MKNPYVPELSNHKPTVPTSPKMSREGLRVQKSAYRTFHATMNRATVQSGSGAKRPYPRRSYARETFYHAMPPALSSPQTVETSSSVCHAGRPCPRKEMQGMGAAGRRVLCRWYAAARPQRLSNRGMPRGACVRVVENAAHAGVARNQVRWGAVVMSATAEKCSSA